MWYLAQLGVAGITIKYGMGPDRPTARAEELE
jgi:hypothetical protein